MSASPSASAGPASRAPSDYSLPAADKRRIVIGLMVALLLASLDQTIVATAMPTIGRDLHDTTNLPWIVTAYLLAATGATPLYGKLSDIHGRRPMLLISLSIFLVGSALCGLSRNMVVLVLARFVQGIGGGGLLALAQTIIGDIMSPRERASYQAYFSTAFMTSSLAGPVLGGFFAEHLHWSMIFWINLPIGLAGLLLMNGPLKTVPRHERPHKLDIIGAALLITASSSLLLGLTWAGPHFGWTSVPTDGVFVTSALLLALFLVRMRRIAEPLIPIEVLYEPVVLTATAAASLSVGLFLGMAIYMPIYFESLQRLSASGSGLALLPLMAGTVCGATLAARVIARYRHYKRLPLILLPVAMLIAAGLALGVGGLPTWVVSVLVGVLSIALGTLLPISTLSIQNAVPFHRLGTAVATANLCRQLSGAIFVAVFGVVVIGAGAHGIAGHHEVAKHMVAIDHTILRRSFQVVFGLVALGHLAAILAVVLMEERPLDGQANSGRALAAASVD